MAVFLGAYLVQVLAIPNLHLRYSTCLLVAVWIVHLSTLLLSIKVTLVFSNLYQSQCFSLSPPPPELRMIAAGKFASLPRNMQLDREFSLASSMDLISSKPSLAERRLNTCHDVSIHGTLPRKKKGAVPSRSCDVFSHVGTLPYFKAHRPQGPLMQDVIDEYPQQNWRSDAFHHRYHLKYYKLFLSSQIYLHVLEVQAHLFISHAPCVYVYAM